ncbi:hypothetical protein N7492_004262 [Penicillium capsulatum]|uniref:Mid2 domain-containing protein n=1 Tax=Penicillium capsulatum TaxID=69766 RepID=A0A9W9LPV5_9EURO|nr:hypothetical protein N7492_004262 [Penicillium capsulatum]KAJ6136618.1 hypothetical protein N7512_001778 [Penicillium capsulatum]
MLVRAVVLVALSWLPDVSALDAPWPSSTLSETRPQPMAPQPTPGMHLRRGIARHQEPQVTSSEWSDQPNLCGWAGASLDHPISCDPESTCRYHAANANFSGMMGCCGEQGCAFQTACFDAEQISKTPTLTDTPGAFSLYCTQSSLNACMTTVYSDISVTDYACGASSTRLNAYTSAFDHHPGDAVVSRWDHYLPRIHDTELSSYEAQLAPTPRSQAAIKVTGLAHSRRSSDSSESSESQNSPYQNHKPLAQKGAIGGGVAGGVAGGVLIALGVVYVMRRQSRKKEQAKADAEANDQGSLRDPGASINMGDYPTKEPETSPYHSASENHAPAEMASSDPSHCMAEAVGCSPIDRAHEMPGEAPSGTTSEHFVAELPAESVPVEKA